MSKNRLCKIHVKIKLAFFFNSRLYVIEYSYTISGFLLTVSRFAFFLDSSVVTFSFVFKKHTSN